MRVVQRLNTKEREAQSVSAVMHGVPRRGKNTRGYARAATRLLSPATTRRRRRRRGVPR